MVGHGLRAQQRVDVVGVEGGLMPPHVAPVEARGDVVDRYCGVEAAHLGVGVLPVAAPHLNAAGHHDAEQPHVALVGTRGAGGVVAEFQALVLGGHLDDDALCGIAELITSGGVEHVLQLHRAGGIVPAAGGRCALSIGGDIEDGGGTAGQGRCVLGADEGLGVCLGQLAGLEDLGGNAAGTVVLVGALVDLTVLDAGVADDVNGELVSEDGIGAVAHVDAVAGGGCLGGVLQLIGKAGATLICIGKVPVVVINKIFTVVLERRVDVTLTVVLTIDLDDAFHAFAIHR